ncbi:MAG: GspH/FimT family pseudopilin [Deltaproteobacteria bacterium]|nr:GspH/FimT family pseudopilin [Deltaproteobacteria bacterium]
MGSQRRTGFTLIEMMAVITLVGMIFALGLPRLSSARWRALGDAAESVAASLEFARQRAVMTGVPHRVLIDLEDGEWRVEWLVSESEAAAGELRGGAAGGGPSLAGALAGALGGGADDESEPDPRAPIDLHPPTKAGLDYYPIPSPLGRFKKLDEDDILYFVGLEGNSGWVEGGDVQIVFDADGTTDFVLLELADADDRHLTLEIEPLLDRIRRREGPARS